MAATYAQRLAKAMALDDTCGTEHRGDAVIFDMLDLVGRRARGEMPKAQTPPAGATQAARSGGRQGVGSPNGGKVAARVLVKSQPASRSQQARDDAELQAIAEAAHAAKKPDDGKVLRAAAASLSPEQLAAAIDAAVAAGKISGTAAMELLKRVKGGR